MTESGISRVPSRTATIGQKGELVSLMCSPVNRVHRWASVDPDAHPVRYHALPARAASARSRWFYYTAARSS